MSLPPALLQRLAQRGLVQDAKKSKKSSTSTENPSAPNEEIIAEDYDESGVDVQGDGDMDKEYTQFLYKNENENSKRKAPEEHFWVGRMRERLGVSASYLGYKNCPNKYNIYHKCTLYCVKRWEIGRKEPSEKYMKRYRRMIKKYPLSKGWTEKYDPGCGCYYFINVRDNVVSWLPPSHPNSRVSISAASYRSKLDNTYSVDDDDEPSSLRPEALCDNNSQSEDKTTAATSRSNPIFDDPQADQVSEAKYKKRKYRDVERAISKKRKDPVE